MIRAVGIDPSISRTGLCGPGLLVSFSPPRDVTGYARHWYLAERVIAEVVMAAPAIVVLETYLVYGPRPNVPGIELGGLLRVILTHRGIPWTEVPPMVLKKFAAGTGKAKKPEMVAAAVDAGADPANDDEADAYWLRRAAEVWYNDPSHPRRDTLEKVAWPILEDTP